MSRVTLRAIFLLPVVMAGAMPCATADERPVASAATDAAPGVERSALAELEGTTATVELSSGTVYENLAISRVTFHSHTEEPSRLYGTTDSGRRRSFKFSAIRRISVGDQPVYESEGEDAGVDATDKEHEQWLARLAARGIKPWEPLTQEEHDAAIAAHKKRYEEVANLLPTLQLYETERFLFCTNIPPQQVGVFIASLDRMYAYMQRTYGIDPDTPVWRGKASVFAFVREEEFAAFERQFMKNDPKPGTAGLCHYDSDRNVCIAVHQGTSADYFGIVLVHETSHGFIHCYKTPVRVPSWVNEGMAEVIASLMVPTSDGVQKKEKKFLNSILQMPQPRLGDAFFAVDRNIPFDRYGGASSMTRFLLQTDQRKYVKFIDLLKEGTPWEEALKSSYNAGKQQLVAAYGRWIGVPHLQP